MFLVFIIIFRIKFFLVFIILTDIYKQGKFRFLFKEKKVQVLSIKIKFKIFDRLACSIGTFMGSLNGVNSPVTFPAQYITPQLDIPFRQRKSL